MYIFLIFGIVFFIIGLISLIGNKIKNQDYSDEINFDIPDRFFSSYKLLIPAGLVFLIVFVLLLVFRF